MPLFVLVNMNVNRVLNDLMRICPDPGLSVNIGLLDMGGGILYEGDGRVSYTPSISDVGSNLIFSLVSSPAYIGIRGEASGFNVTPSARLCDMAGLAIGYYPNTQTIDVMYDVQNCNGKGYFTYDSTGAKISIPSHVALFHELVHAKHMASGTLNVANAENQAISEENQFRSVLGLPLRQGHGGGCNTPETPPSSGDGGDCFIATAAFGGTHQEVQHIRFLRDHYLSKNRVGKSIISLYNKVSSPIAKFIGQSEILRMVVRFMLYPFVALAIILSRKSRKD